MKSVNPYPQRTRPSTMDGPQPVLSGALAVHNLAPVRVLSAARTPESVPTNATPRTAPTGAKIFPGKSSACQRIFPDAGSSPNTLAALVGKLVWGLPTFDTAMSRPSTSAAEPISPPNTLPGVSAVSPSTSPVSRWSAWYTPPLSPAPTNARPLAVQRLGDAPTSASLPPGFPALNTSGYVNCFDHLSFPVL